jgi:hypothetical protein
MWRLGNGLLSNRPRNDGDGDSRGAGLSQGSCRLAAGGACGEDIVYDQHMGLSQMVSGPNRNGVPHVVPALWRSEVELAHGVSAPSQQSFREW